MKWVETHRDLFRIGSHELKLVANDFLFQQPVMGRSRIFLDSSSKKKENNTRLVGKKDAMRVVELKNLAARARFILMQEGYFPRSVVRHLT